MNNAPLNAFKGFSYQQNVFMYFVGLMDVERKITEISAEVPDYHNFDDIKIKIKENSYFVQTKNYEIVNELRIDKNKVIINGNISVASEEGINLFVVKNGCITPNDKIFGLDSYRENNIYIIPISVEKIFYILTNIYNGMDARLNKIIAFAAEKSSINNNIIKQDMLPEFGFFSNELIDKTIKIRNFMMDKQKKLLMIVGKPGIGKSHLVNEIEIENKILYRFWISEQDIDKNKRLCFDNFIKQISSELFGDLCKYSLEDIVKKLSSDNRTLILDGLDHVENYNLSELTKYIDFVNKVNESKNNKTLIFTRPLITNLDWESFVLDNWSKEETFLFLETKYAYNDYSLKNDIYAISKGYPIITDFIAKHYLQNKTIPNINDIEDINDYYRKLIDNSLTEEILTLFTIARSYLTFKELSKVMDMTTYKIIIQFINTHKYLFQIELNRVSLIHDSFNTFLIKKVGISETEKKKLFVEIKSSIERKEIDFLSRISFYEFDNDFKIWIVQNYFNFETFEELIKNNLDYESITEFYQHIYSYLEIFHPSMLDIYCCYEIVLIMNIVARDNIEQADSLIYNLIKYSNKKSFSHENIFSSGTIYSMYNLFVAGNHSIYQNYLSNRNYSVESVYNSLYENYSIEKTFFDSLTKNKSLEEIIKFEQEEVISLEFEEYRRQRNMSKILVDIYVSRIEYKDYFSIVSEYVENGSIESIDKLKRIFMNINIRSFMAKWSLEEAKETIMQLGLSPAHNDYKNLTLNDFIEKYSNTGSFRLREKIAAYIRLAIYDKRQIDIKSVYKYFCMYYNRKDYSFISLGEALFSYMKKDQIDFKESLDILQKAMDLSEKGINHIASNFTNLLNEKEINILENQDIFLDKYTISIDDLNYQIINFLSVKSAMKKLFELLNYNFESKTIEFRDLKGILFSNYSDKVIEYLRKNDFTILNVPENINIEYDKITKSEKSEGKRAFDKGYLSIEDFEYIKSLNISHLELSKYLDGWNSSLSDVKFYEMFDKKILRKDFVTIIYNSMIKAKSKEGYSGDVYYLVGNMPLLAYSIDYDVDWPKLYNLFVKFLNISLLEI